MKSEEAHHLLQLGWVRWRLLRAQAVALARTGLKLTVVLCAWAILLIGLYLLAHQGLHFIYQTAGLGPFLLDRLWYLFLFMVSILLAVSQLASAYSSLVRSPETRWWMGLPLAPRILYRAKWIESSFYSAWAVLLLIAPFSLAYLVVLQRPLWLLGWMALILVPLIALVTALSTAVLLVWLRWCGRLAIRREVMAVGFVVVCGALFWLLGEQRGEEADVWFVALQELLPRMRMAMAPWLPSSWVAKALGAGLNARWIEGFLYASLLWTSALFAWRLSDHIGSWLLFPLLRRSTLSSEGSFSVRSALRRLMRRLRRGRGSEEPITDASRESPAALSRSLLSQSGWMRGPFRASLVKDLLLVIRDPMQWSQGVVFFGLLGAYFANIHRLTQISPEPSWRIGLASLNLACTLLVLGSLAVRFLFPQMSLESRRLWLLQVAPNGIRHLVGAKLFLYGGLALFIVEGLLWLSTNRLGLPITIRWWLSGVGSIAALTIVGMNVGFGAWWMDPAAQDAAQVVSSSSGALVLVLMLGYVALVVVALVAVWLNWLGAPRQGLLITSLALMASSALLVVVPVNRGLVRLRRLNGLTQAE